MNSYITDKHIGIDFGASRCRTAVEKNGEIKVVPNRYSDNPVPPIVLYSPNSINFSSIKQKIGSDDKLNHGKDGILPVDYAVSIFSVVQNDIDRYTGSKFLGAVITVPSCTTDRFRTAVKSTAEKSGFNSIKLLNESKAAVIDLDIKDEGKTVLVYSLGAGIFSVSIYRIVNGIPVDLCHDGDLSIGGFTFNSLIAKYLLNKAEYTFDITDKHFRNEIHDIVEKIKLKLTEKTSLNISMNNRDFSFTREEFENLIYEKVSKTIEITKNAIRDAKISREDIDLILIQGGSTNIPLVKRMVQENIGENISCLSSESIVRGAAKYGSHLPVTVKNEASPVVVSNPLSINKESKAIPEIGIPNSENKGWLNSYLSYLSESQALWAKGERENSILQLEKYFTEIKKFIAHLYYSNGDLLLKENKFGEAITSLEKALLYNNNDDLYHKTYHEAYHLYVKYLREIGDLANARSVIEHGRKIFPKCNWCKEMFQVTNNDIQRRNYSGLQHSKFTQQKKKRK